MGGAFFLTDVLRLYDIAVSFVPESSPFRSGLQDIRRWHAGNSDWKETWLLVRNKYRGYTLHGDYKFSSIINGLMGAVALLYGGGNFLLTVGLAIAAGFDNDNQAATLAGFIGVLHGSSCIPKNLTHEVRSSKWTEPFNDRYIN